jgi:MFS family permease
VRPPRGVRRDLRLSFGDGAGYGLMAGMAEVYLPAFALAIGMPPVLAGLLATTPLLAGGLLQLLAPRAIVRQKSLRRWVVACVIVQALAFVPLLVVAMVGTLSTPIIFASAALYWAAGMGASAGWNPWMARVVPARIRSRIFGRRQGLAQATMLAGLIGAGATLHAASGGPHVLDVFAAMFGLACTARLGSALMLAKMGAGVDVSPRRRVRLRSMPQKLRGTPRGALLAFVITASSAAAISGAFITPYLLHFNRLDYVPYAVFTATIVVSKIVFSPMLGRLMQRIGLHRVMSACALAIAPIPLMYIASDAYPWLLFIQFYGGIAWGGFELGALMVLFDAEDDGERTTMQVAYSGLNAVGNASASFIGGALLASLGSDHDAYVWVFLVSAVARTGAALLVVKNLPLVLARLPATVVVGAWTLAIRPWGGTIVRPIVEGISKLRR